MADAPEPVFSAEELYPKYTLSTTEENTSNPRSPYPTEKPAMRSYPSTADSPSSSANNLPSISTASPWNNASPPQYTVDTPVTHTPPASQTNLYPTYMNDAHQDTVSPLVEQRSLEMMTMTKSRGMEGGVSAAEESWRVSFWDCCGGDSGLCCDALWVPCVLAGQTHQKVKGLDAGMRVKSLNGYVRCKPSTVARLSCGSFASSVSSLLTVTLPVLRVRISCADYVWPMDPDDDGTERYQAQVRVEGEYLCGLYGRDVLSVVRAGTRGEGGEHERERDGEGKIKTAIQKTRLGNGVCSRRKPWLATRREKQDFCFWKTISNM